MGMAVTSKCIRTWCIKFSDSFAQGLRHRDEMCVDVGTVKHWLWRAVNEHGAVLDVLFRHTVTPRLSSYSSTDC